MTLDQMKVGQVGTIITLTGKGQLRHRLLELGCTPKVQITIIKMAPLGDPIEIKVRGYDLTIRKEEAKLIEVGDVK